MPIPINNIAHTPLPVKPNTETNPQKEIHLSRLTYALLARLAELRNKFRAERALAKDGSFFQGNDELAKWLHCTERGIMKARKYLVDTGKIKHQAIAIKGKASLYWILDRPQKQQQEKNSQAQERPAIDPLEQAKVAALIHKTVKGMKQEVK